MRRHLSNREDGEGLSRQKEEHVKGRRDAAFGDNTSGRSRRSGRKESLEADYEELCTY